MRLSYDSSEAFTPSSLDLQTYTYINIHIFHMSKSVSK